MIRTIDRPSKIDILKDYVEPVFIKNFCNCVSSIAKDLMPEVASILKGLDWHNDFIIYRYSDRQYVRLYLRVAYVSAYHIDGRWEEIKTKLPKIIPLVKSMEELRKEKDGELLWIEKNVKDLHWTKINSPCIICDTYQTNDNLHH